MAVVTAFSCIERFLGFIYRIYLSRNLGAEGVGIYQIAISVIGLLMTLTASGIPITVSRIMIKHTSEHKENLSNKTVTAGILTSLVLSIPIVLILYIFLDDLTFLFADERCAPVLKIMLPGVVITSVYAVIRGYFWGKKKFFTYSTIELLEEAVMLVSGIILVNLATSSLEGAKRAGYAVLISYVFSFIVSISVFFISGGKLQNPQSELKPLISSSAPITVMRTVTSLINTLIAIILPARLVSFGLSSSEALASFGELSGMSIPLIYIPSTLIGSIALVLVPELSKNFYDNNFVSLKNNIENAIKCSVFISTLIIPSFIALGEELGVILYDNYSAGIYVSRASIIMLPMSITMISTSMLNSLNLEKKTLFYYLIGATLLLVSIYFLPKFIGVYSLIVGLLTSYIITSVFNLILIKKTCKNPPKFLLFIILSIIFIIPSALLCYLLKGILIRFLPSVIVVIICSIITVIFDYLFFKVFDLFDVKILLNK